MQDIYELLSKQYLVYKAVCLALILIATTLSARTQVIGGINPISSGNMVIVNLRTSGLEAPSTYGNTTVRVNGAYVGNATDKHQLVLQFLVGSNVSIQVERVVTINVEGGRDYYFGDWNVNGTCCSAGPTINLLLFGDTNLTAEYATATPDGIYSSSQIYTVFIPIFVVTIALTVTGLAILYRKFFSKKAP